MVESAVVCLSLILSQSTGKSVIGHCGRCDWGKMRKYVYADESGNFDFSRNRGASQYFILTTVTLDDHDVGNRLTELRRELAWEGVEVADGFHATEDLQAVRDEVFGVLQGGTFRVDATIIDKPKTYPSVRSDEWRFYRYAWSHHMKYVAPRVAGASDELLIIAASIGTKKQQSAVKSAIQDVMSQVSPTPDTQCAVWSAASDTSIQIADYCSWAIQRRWERNDWRSYNLLKSKIASEYDLFRSGTRTFY